MGTMLLLSLWLGVLCSNLTPSSATPTNLSPQLSRTERQENQEVTISACTTDYTAVNIESGKTYKMISPNYPESYPNNKRCHYRINLGEGVGSAEFRCSTFDLEASGSCSYDYLQIGATTFCGSISPSVDINQMTLVVFKSDNTVNGPGYECTLTPVVSTITIDPASTTPTPFKTVIIGCDQEETIDLNQALRVNSPGYPEYNYFNNFDCTLQLRRGLNAGKLRIDCTDAFDVDGTSSCWYDYLLLTGAEDSHKYCGHKIPRNVVFESDAAIRFKTDGDTNRAGFSCTVTGLAP